MNTFTYKPNGVCAQSIDFILDGTKIIEVHVKGGCSGNLQGICNILKNKEIQEVLDAFEGVKCRDKETSCPDQIAQALKQYVELQKV